MAIINNKKEVLSSAWEKRKVCKAKGDRLRAKGDKLGAEGEKLWAGENKLCALESIHWAEGHILWAKGGKLEAEGEKLWAETVFRSCGNISLQWHYRPEKDDYACELETGEIYEP